MAEQTRIKKALETNLKRGLEEGRYYAYPRPNHPLTEYDEIVADPELFRTTFDRFHSLMGTTIVHPSAGLGGATLDFPLLHKLFVEVTSRNGANDVSVFHEWKEVAVALGLPEKAGTTLRKYYLPLLVHYQNLYFGRAVAYFIQKSGLYPKQYSGISASREGIQWSVDAEGKLVPAPPLDPTMFQEGVHWHMDAKGKLVYGPKKGQA